MIVALEEVVVVAYLDVKPTLKALPLDEVVLVGYGGPSSKQESKKSESSGSKSHPGTLNEIEENRE